MKFSSNHKFNLGDFVNVEYKLDQNKIENFSGYIIGVLHQPQTYVVDCVSSKNYLEHAKTLNEITDKHIPLFFMHLYIDTLGVLVYEEELSLIDKGKVIFNNGMHCIECKEYNSYATANTKDCRYLCYSCKESARWKYKKIIF